jgi:hypothetical protein
MLHTLDFHYSNKCSKCFSSALYDAVPESALSWSLNWPRGVCWISHHDHWISTPLTSICYTSWPHIYNSTQCWYCNISCFWNTYCITTSSHLWSWCQFVLSTTSYRHSTIILKPLLSFHSMLSISHSDMHLLWHMSVLTISLTETELEASFIYLLIIYHSATVSLKSPHNTFIQAKLFWKLVMDS